MSGITDDRPKQKLMLNHLNRYYRKLQIYRYCGFRKKYCLRTAWDSTKS